MSQDCEFQEWVMTELVWEPGIDASHIGIAAK